MSLRLLWRHASRRADCDARFGQFGLFLLGQSGKTEIGDLDMALLSEQDVGSFDVAMDDSAAGVRQPLDNLDRPIDRLAQKGNFSWRDFSLHPATAQGFLQADIKNERTPTPHLLRDP